MWFFVFIKTLDALDIRHDTEGKPRLESVILILIRMLVAKEITDAGWQQFFAQVDGFYKKNIMIDAVLITFVRYYLSYNLLE